VLAESGEDAIAYSTTSHYAANVEMVEAPPPSGERPKPTTAMALVNTPNQQTIEQVSQFLKVKPSQCIKTLLVNGTKGLVALILRGDHTLNIIKATKHPQIANPLTFAAPEKVKEILGCNIGSLGPIGLTLPIIVDHSAAHLADFVCGANKDGQHLVGINWGRDLPEPQVFDLRNVQAGDPSPDGQGVLSIARGIEVGHIFQLGDKYSRAMQANILDEEGKAIILTMGCYGIGVSRIVAAAIEQNHDDQGIIWPAAIAPFKVALLPMNMHKSQRLREAAVNLYEQLQLAGIEVLFDDRKERPGVMFADMELIGIPHRLVLGDRGLDKNEIEYKGRRDPESRTLPISEIIQFLQTQS